VAVISPAGYCLLLLNQQRQSTELKDFFIKDSRR